MELALLCLYFPRMISFTFKPSYITAKIIKYDRYTSFPRTRVRIPRSSTSSSEMQTMEKPTTDSVTIDQNYRCSFGQLAGRTKREREKEKEKCDISWRIVQTRELILRERPSLLAFSFATILSLATSI